MFWSIPRHLKIAYKWDFQCLYTLTFQQKVDFLISNALHCKYLSAIWGHWKGTFAIRRYFYIEFKGIFWLQINFYLLHLIFKCNFAITGQKCHILIALSFAWEMPFNSWKNLISESKCRFWVWGHWKGTFTCRRHIFLESKCRVWAWGQKIKTNSKS